MKFQENFDIVSANINIIKEIKRETITGEVPKDAQFAFLNLDGTFIQKLYKFAEHGMLHYYGEQGGWHWSEYNTNGKDFKYLKDKMIYKIID